MGSIMMIQLLNNRFTFKELKNNDKIFVDVFVFLLLHMYRRHQSPSVREMCPIPDVPLMGENIIIFFFKQNVLSVQFIFENIHITESYIIIFLVKNLEPLKEFAKFEWAKPLQK